MTAKRRRSLHAVAVISLVQAGGMVVDVDEQLILHPIAPRSIDDIDSRDADNPLLVTCYVDQLYDHFLELEQRFRVSSHYMAARQRFIDPSMRSILVDSLVEIHLKLRMVPESLYLAVNIIDRFLQVTEVRRSQLNLVGVASLMIAEKYEVLRPGVFSSLASAVDDQYSTSEVLLMERSILVALDYRLNVPTAHVFLCRYLKAAHADLAVALLASYLTEHSLQEYRMLRFLPSIVAATAVRIARKTSLRHPWSPTLERYCKVDEAGLVECGLQMQAMMALQDDDATDDDADDDCGSGLGLKAVHSKYSSSSFGAVARRQLLF